jgi:hypothetical protein
MTLLRLNVENKSVARLSYVFYGNVIAPLQCVRLHPSGTHHNEQGFEYFLSYNYHDTDRCKWDGTKLYVTTPEFRGPHILDDSIEKDAGISRHRERERAYGLLAWFAIRLGYQVPGSLQGAVAYVVRTHHSSTY